MSVGPGRVDAEWVAERRAEGIACLTRARELVGAAPHVEFRTVASSSAAHGLSDLVEEVRGSAACPAPADPAA